MQRRVAPIANPTMLNPGQTLMIIDNALTIHNYTSLIRRQVSYNNLISGTGIALVWNMVMRIDKSNISEFVVFTFSGRIENEKITELKEILALEQANKKIAFDLENVKLVDQHSVEFLEKCESQGVELWNCPVYLREWIVRIRAGNRL
jgi:hypothetical protein